MNTKTILITGATDGIGKATAVELAKLGHHIVLVYRNEAKGNATRDEITKSTGNKNIDLLYADFCSLDSIRSLAETVNRNYERIDVLINNAGIFTDNYRETGDGFEMQFQVNHLAPFLLTNLLLDKLKSSAPSRIVNVSSDAHFNGSIRFDNLGHKGKYNGRLAYRQSKLANVLFSNELGRKLADTDVIVNSLHPGTVCTDIGCSNATGWIKYGWKIVKIAPGTITPQKSAETLLHVALSEAAGKASGKYYDKSREVTPALLTHDEQLAKKLWEVSEQLTGLSKTSHLLTS